MTAVRRLLTVGTVAVLYAVFSLAAMLAGGVGLVGLACGRTTYASNICRAMDALLAAMLRWDGRSTVSKECGRSGCRFCRWLCAALNFMLERGHCAKEAARD